MFWLEFPSETTVVDVLVAPLLLLLLWQELLQCLSLWGASLDSILGGLGRGWKDLWLREIIEVYSPLPHHILFPLTLFFAFPISKLEDVQEEGS